MKKEKLKVLHVDLGSCEGCGISALRAYFMMRESYLYFTPYLRDGEVEPDEVDIALVTGAACLNDEKAINKLKEVRKKAKMIIAFGSCASFGGILRFARGGQEPKPEHRIYQPINSVIKVDYSIPGCPPPYIIVMSFFKFLLKGDTSRLKLFEEAARIKKLSGFDLIDDVVLTGICVGCGACELSCPTKAIKLIDRRPVLMPEKCIRCGTCYIRCPRASNLLVSRGGLS